MENYFNLHTCEQCGTTIHLNRYHQIVECPICGLLSITDDKKMVGNLILTSPEQICDQDPNSENVVLLNDIESEIDESIRILLKNGWRLKFKTD